MKRYENLVAGRVTRPVPMETLRAVEKPGDTGLQLARLARTLTSAHVAEPSHMYIIYF